MDEEIITFEAFMDVIQATDEEKAVISKLIMVSARLKENNFLALLKKQNAGWLIEMLEVLRFELDQKNITPEDFLLVSGVLGRTLEWLVEGSNYLSHFDRARQVTIEERVEKYWNEVSAFQKALQLIATGKDIEYISDKVRKWKISGYLFGKEQVIIMINTIFRFSMNLNDLSTNDLIQLVYYALNENLADVTRYFHERVAWLKDHDFELFYEERNEEHVEHLTNAIWILGASILEGEKSPDELACTRSMFFRYLHETCHSSVELIRDNAFNSLLFYQKNTLFSWDDLLKFSVSDLTGAIVSKTSVAVRNASERLFEEVGLLRVTNDTITLSPLSSSRKPTTLVEINGMELQVCSNKKINLDGDFLDTLVSWKDVFNGYTIKQTKKEICKKRPPVGTVLKIRVKMVYQAKPTLVFALIESDEYEGEGALHVSHVTRVKLESLENILFPGDVLLASVCESTDERLQFSILEEIEMFVGLRYHVGEPINALLLNANNELLTWVSEPGFILFSKPAPSFSPQVGEFYLLEIQKVYLNGYVAAKIEMSSNVFFDRHEAVAKLVRQYVNYSKSIENTKTVKEDTNEDEKLIFSKRYVVELTRVLQLYMGSKNSITNLNLLCFLKLIAHVMDDPNLKEYYNCCIRYLTTLQVFIKGEGRANVDVELESDFSRYPVLKQRGNIFKLLSAVNQKDYNVHELVDLVESSDKYLSRVAKLVLAGNLVYSSPAASEVIRQELLRLLSIDFESIEVEEEKIEFGSENGTREFKSSAVYPAEAQWQADLDKQVSVILKTICGFLNAVGGVLYIGVNDFGIPDGIKTDLDYLRCNTDKYELFLRKQIVENFGGDVNGLVVIKFRYFGEVIVCAVSVPSYHSVVMLNSMVWQRQGNSTLLVTGADLRLLKRRKKMQAELSRMADTPLFPDDKEYEL
ncbi:helix-turn-helix domain-containing protein [Butyricimonas virosa]|uniref:AlbA family DNA-binding domain-containing protein n=1 Tax=Butyricimonas virosa TaxID=544645 RepID=UPI00242AEA9F|nr:ATP-binding protein [Butyricimonas virosa]